MRKTCLLTVALLSLALAGGCAKGGNGAGNGIVVTVSDKGPLPGNINAAYVTQQIQFSATVTGTSNLSVAWSISGKGCTGGSNPCGTIDGSGLYTAPATPPNPSSLIVTATSLADSTARGSQSLNIVPVTVTITPGPTVNVGHGLVQQFVATQAPDLAPSTFTWTCTANGVACANFVASSSDVAVYTAADSACGGCVQISAVSTVNPTGCTLDAKDCHSAKVSVASSRLTPGNYAFHFTGYDSSNNPVAVAGSIAVTSGGAITGVESELSSTGPSQNPITAGSFTPSTYPDNSSNNAGTLKLTTGAFPNQYQVVIDASGDLQMIETDGHGSGSGVMQKSATAQFTGAQKFVFGFTGHDSGGKRVGYVGLLPLDGVGNITGGQADVNDNGNANAACAAPPCTVSGTYQFAAGVGTMSLLVGSQILDFDFYIASGQANAKNPLTLYAISADTVDATHPAISGMMAYQDPGTPYDKTALNINFSVDNLTGVDTSGTNTLVSLITAFGDGNGTYTEVFSSNNAGKIVAADPKSAAKCPYTTGTGGRYVVTMLGAPSTCGATTGTPTGIPVVLYASGANRGFLLDQSSAAVMTGSMDPQDGNLLGPSALAGTYAAATVSSATSAAAQKTLTANLTLTYVDFFTHNVAGTQYPGPQTVTGTYDFTGDGFGPITLTAPAAANYIIYPLDATHFEMLNVDGTNKTPSLIFAQQ
jgi:hypothetical protein